jgi:hypothetical protein
MPSGERPLLVQTLLSIYTYQATFIVSINTQEIYVSESAD